MTEPDQPDAGAPPDAAGAPPDAAGSHPGAGGSHPGAGGSHPDADALEVVRSSRTPIDVAAVERALTAPQRWRIEHTVVTGSTNADLSARVTTAESGQVLTTEEQLSGRGRSGRDWFCPAGAGLMFSVLVRLPQVPVDRRGWTGALLGLAIVTGIGRVCGVRAGVKWPNDVLVDGRKCAGILGEMVDDAVVVGAGINVSLGADELPRPDATSLLLIGAHPLPAALDRAVLLAGILDAFGDLLDRWVAADGDIDVSGLRSDYRSSCATIGSDVRLMLPGGRQLLARAVDVAADGALLVEDGQGRVTAYSAADVVHLRPHAGPVPHQQ
ncbi:biotin--[acetyl-CoA-carboxylase] ligase [Nakamurella sp. GG22]